MTLYYKMQAIFKLLGHAVRIFRLHYGRVVLPEPCSMRHERETLIKGTVVMAYNTQTGRSKEKSSQVREHAFESCNVPRSRNPIHDIRVVSSSITFRACG